MEDTGTYIVKSRVSVPFINLEANEKDPIAIPSGLLEVFCKGLASVEHLVGADESSTRVSTLPINTLNLICRIAEILPETRDLNVFNFPSF